MYCFRAGGGANVKTGRCGSVLPDMHLMTLPQTLKEKKSYHTPTHTYTHTQTQAEDFMNTIVKDSVHLFKWTEIQMRQILQAPCFCR